MNVLRLCLSRSELVVIGVSEERKIIARAALQALGGTPLVARYWDEKRGSHVDVLTASDRPYEGVISYSTIGLSEYSIDHTAHDKPLRVELVGACAAQCEYYPNLLATCIFQVMNANDLLYPGKILRDVVKMYDPFCEMCHVLFVAPFLWKELRTLDLPDKKVAWLLAVPISEQEYLFAAEHGTDALEDLFERAEIDLFDIKRKSVC